MSAACRLLIAAFVLAPGLLCAQATLWLNRGVQLFCPGAPALANIIFTNRTTIPQTIPAGTILRLAFPVALDGTGAAPQGIALTQEVNVVTATFPTAYTVAAYNALRFQSIPLHSIPAANHTAISVRVILWPATAITLIGEGYHALVGLVDTNACVPSPAFTVDDVTLACPSAAELSAFNSKTVFRFEGDPTAGQLVCRAADGSADLTRLQERAYQALRLMQILQFQSPLPWTEKSLYDWFTHAVRGVRFRTDTEYAYCCDPDGYINIPSKTLGAVQFNTSEWLGTLMVLFAHEARHNEGLPHTCGTWDLTLSELGSWGVQYYLNEWIALRTGIFFSPRPGGGSPGGYRAFYWDSAQYMFDVSICDAAVGMTVAPRKLDFGTQTAGVTSLAKTVAFTATRGAPGSVDTVTLGGANPGDFILGGESCSGVTAPPTCAMLVSFKPQGNGLRTATLTSGLGVVTLSGNSGSPPCTYSLSRSNEVAPATGADGALDVTAPAGCPWNAQSKAQWISLTVPVAGSGGGRIGYSVAANPGSSPRVGTINVMDRTFAVVQPGTLALKVPTFSAQGIMNSASFVSGAPAGSLATIFGANLSTSVTGSLSATIFPYPEKLGESRVLLNGIPAPLVGVANTGGLELINVQIPWELAGRNPVTVVVENAGVKSAPVQIDLPAVRPGIFTIDGLNAVVQHVCPSGVSLCVVTAAEPARAGEPVVLYATGLGPVDYPVRTNQPAPMSEPFARTTAPLEVTIGGITAKVDFSGLAPGFAGLYQINARVPDGVSGAMVPIVVWAAGEGSKPAFMVIR